MPLPDVTEQWSSRILEVILGEGSNQMKIGGHSTLPFLHFEGDTIHQIKFAMEVHDCEPEGWGAVLTEPFCETLKNPVEWAKKCVDEYGADMICIMLKGIDPDFGDRPAEHAVKVVSAVADAVNVPLIVWGCGVDDKDNQILPAVSSATAGENCLIGTAREKNYRTLVATCLADKHKLVAESPLDINIAKQVNILCTDAGFPLEDIVIFPTTGALGYGIEYVYSIQERGRLAALGGDKTLQQPVLCDVGAEAWRAKEAKAPPFDCVTEENRQEWGVAWEAATAGVLLVSGADLLVMRHPQAIEQVRKLVDRMWT